jgi:hypothetical protein
MILRNRDLSQLMRQSENSTFGAAQHSTIAESSLAADLDLIQRVNSNQPGAIEELIAQHGCHLRRLIASLSGWPKQLDSLREKSRTLVGTHLELRHDAIPFKTREKFESAWPHIVEVKIPGAPIVLRRNTSFWPGQRNA